MHFEKIHFIFTARFDCARLRFQHCFEGSIVFTRITGILISLSLEIPCVCCGLRWTLQAPTAPRHFSTFFFFNTLDTFQKAESCVETSANSHFLLWLFKAYKQPLHLSLLFCLASFFPPPIVSESLFILSFGCQLWVTLAGDYSAYSLSSKDEWFHYSGGKNERGQLVVINSGEGEALWRAP